MDETYKTNEPSQKSFFRKYLAMIIAAGVIIPIAIVILVISVKKYNENSLINSVSYAVALAHTEANAEVPYWAGEIIDYEFISGSESFKDEEGTAEYRIAIICEEQTVNAGIFLRKKAGEDWKVWSFGIPG